MKWFLKDCLQTGIKSRKVRVKQKTTPRHGMVLHNNLISYFKN
jgi:hypothetical protein